MTEHLESGSEFEELVRAVRRGEPAARDGLLRRLRPRLIRWARGLTGESDTAEDLAQETMLRVDRSLDRFADGGFLSWSYRILLNLQRDRLRTESRRRDILSTDAESVPTPSAPGPDPHEAVRAFVDELSPQQRAAFQLADLEGWSIDDVAGALEISPSTARVHLHRARRTIRARILENTP